MNESETRAELIDPKLKSCGWGVIENSKILRERDVCKITDGRIQVGGKRQKPLIADYILVYKNIKLAIVEAKSSDLEVGEGVAQAKLYAQKLNLEYTYSTNGKEIYQINMKTGEEELIDNYPTPEELWNKIYSNQNEWREKLFLEPFKNVYQDASIRYYIELAVNNSLEAISQKKDRILLTLATGTGKTYIAFQIAWKLFHTRWNLSAKSSEYKARRPRILFLADRNILADQALISFSSFPEDAIVRITPAEIKKRGKVPTNASIFFTIFQSFMTENSTSSDQKNIEKNKTYNVDIKESIQNYSMVSENIGDSQKTDKNYNFGEYPQDYFDFIIIDECHRGGANDEGNWREILDYFSPAVQLGLTATPKRKFNSDTYKYFGEPVYTYSLKEGINDGFLTPFKVKRIKTTLDDYIYTSDDYIIEGEIEEGKNYKESDFNRIIEIKAREAKRVKIYMDEANQNEKAIIFCATQNHAAAVRDLVNQYKKSKNPDYCVRVTANDGKIGEQFLKIFQDNEKTIPTILTTSQKLSTGVDARNIRNIVLMRPVNQMIEFKQIIGRGTRLFDGKEFFTIYDFVDAHLKFSDPDWDGPPLEEVCKKCGDNPCSCEEKERTPCPECGGLPCICEKPPRIEKECEKCGNMLCTCSKKVKVKLRDGKEREINHMISTSFWSADGKPISAEEFLNNLFGELPKFFKSEAELKELWGNPITRKSLLERLDEAGFGEEELYTLRKLINAEKSDLFDVLEYVFNSDIKPISREERVVRAKTAIFALLNEQQKEFIEFVLSKYVETGVTELDQEKLAPLLINKYQSLSDAQTILGDARDIKNLFVEFQKHLYDIEVA